MKNYKGSDYAVNKYSSGIVYRFADGVVEVTLEIFLSENPGKTKKDFETLKKLSDEIYFEQIRSENAQTKKNIPLHTLGENVPNRDLPPYEKYIEKQEREYAFKAAGKLLKSGVLTETQERRFILYYFQGLSTRQIAEIEGSNQNAVWKSIHACEKKLKKFMKMGGQPPSKSALSERCFSKRLSCSLKTEYPAAQIR